MDKMPLDKGATLIIDRFRGAGYEANVVGGAVRNHILGIPLTDIDIAASALPTETVRLFADHRVIETGIKHGTVTILAEGSSYEVTTYRTDGDYLDNRHPDSVTFTRSLGEDLARRDFTVNAMAYNPYDGITDLFGGREDVAARLIRAVGDSETRFREDALRILRALRFASVLGFDIEENTSLAIRKTAPLLDNVSRERVYAEWVKLIGGDGAYNIISAYPDVIGIAIPELAVITLPNRERFLSQPAAVRALALFFGSCTDPVSSFDTAMTVLHTDTKTRKNGVAALEILKKYNLSLQNELHTALYRHGAEATALAVGLAYTVDRLDGEAYGAATAALATAPITSLSDLAVGGGDMIAIGLRGQAIGAILDILALAVICGECENEKTALINYAKSNINAE